MSDTFRQPMSSPQPEEAGFDFFGFLLRRAWLGLFFGTIGAALAYYYYLQQPIRYRATSQVLVIKQQAEMLVTSVNGLDPSGQRDPLANDARMIMSDAIVGPAVTQYQLNELPTLAGSSNIAQTILSDLTVNRATQGGEVLDITYRSNDPDDCAKVVNAVVDSYNEQLMKAYADVGTQTAELLRDAKEEWQKSLKKAEDDFQAFSEEHSSELLITGDSVSSLSQKLVTDLVTERSRLLLQQTEVQSQLDSIQQAIDRGGSREAILLMVEKFSLQGPESADQSAARPALQAARDVFSLELEEELLLEELGPEHPKVQQIRKKIEMTRRFLQSQSDSSAAVLPVNAKKKDFLEIYIESLQQQKQTIDKSMVRNDELLTKEQNESKKQTTLQIQHRRLRSEIDRCERVFNTLVDRLKDVDLATKVGNYRAQVLERAIRGVQFEPNFQRVMMMGTIMGALVGLLLGFLVESADKSFRNPDEISQVLHLPLVGVSPQIQFGRTEPGSPIAPPLVTIHRPRSQSAEAFRGIRTYLMAATRGDGHKVILVSSPEPGDGKSTMSSNLAVALAQTGKSVLLIDSDMRRPTIHKLFGFKTETGLSDLLDTTDIPIDDAIQTVTFEGGSLHVLPAGRCPSDPGERLMSVQFENLIGALRDKYEWIVLDSPPVLAVTDAATLSRFADGVMLVIRMNGRTRMAAIRAVESFRSLGANLIGIVANGIDPAKHGSYGYQYGVYGSGSRAAKYYAEAGDRR